MGKDLCFIAIHGIGFSGLNASCVFMGLTADGSVYYKSYANEPWERMNMTTLIEDEHVLVDKK